MRPYLADRDARNRMRLVEAKRKIRIWESFWNPKVLWLAMNYFCVVTESVGMLLFLCQTARKSAG